MPAAKTIVASFVPDPWIAWPAGHEPVSSPVFAQNSIDIAAAPETIWSLLIDCRAWPRWYRHCTDVSILRGGPLLGPGSQFRFKTFGYYFEPEIDHYEPSRMLIWSAKGPVGTSGAHAWHVETRPNGCRVVTEEAQKGLLLHLIGRRTRKTLLNSHQDWLNALKALAERA
jgi:hypothetical protein